MRKLTGFLKLFAAVMVVLFMSTASADTFTPTDRQASSEPIIIVLVQNSAGETCQVIFFRRCHRTYGSYIDEPLMMVTGGQKYYYHANNQYSVAALTDASGAVVERYKYDPFGKVTVLAPDGVTTRAVSSVGNPWTFTGRRLDCENGLMYFRARYYDTALGRFINRDPLEYVDGLNLYREYFTPNGTDPTGEFWSWLTSAAGTAAGAVTGAVVGGVVSIGTGIYNGNLSLGGVAGGIAGGAVSGAIIGYGTGAVVGAAAGDPSALIVGGMVVGAVGGAAGAATTTIVQQGIDYGTVNGADVANNATNGAIVGGVTGGITSAAPIVSNVINDAINDATPQVAPAYGGTYGGGAVIPAGAVTNDGQIVATTGVTAAENGSLPYTPSEKIKQWAQNQRAYIDPRTNKWVDTTEPLAADHLYPKDLIKKLPGFDQLTRDEQEWLLNHPDNFQPLPRAWNSSKCNRLADDWAKTPMGKQASPLYIDRLREMQDGFKKYAEAMIELFNSKRAKGN